MNDNQRNIENKILNTVEKYNMISPNSTVVVGVSGGKDSMALLNFLLRIKDEKHLTMIVAHVNHGLRGKESDGDELFVKNFCNDYGIKVEILNVEINNLAKELKMSIEECGRAVRYRFFEELSKKHKAKIALAHTLSDSVETIIFNLSRGTGPMGMCGIPAVRGNVIRPLIDLKTSEVLDYCKEWGLPYVEDSSNQDLKYARNKVRLEIIPGLKTINPAVEETIARTAGLLVTDNEYLNKLAAEKLDSLKVGNDRYDSEKLGKLDTALKTRAIRLAAGLFKPDLKLGFLHVMLIMQIIEQGQGTVMLPGGLLAKVQNGVLRVFLQKHLKGYEYNWEIPLFGCNNGLTEKGRESIIKKVPKTEYEILLAKDKFIEKMAIDSKAVTKETFLRNRRAGDVFSPRDRGLKKTVKKFFNEEKVPPENRYKIPMLANNNDVIWIEGFGACDEFKVDKNTREVLIINVGKNQWLTENVENFCI